MKLTIEEIQRVLEEEIIVRCHDKEADWVNYVKTVEDQMGNLTGSKDGKIYRLKLKEIFYFEVVDNKSFVYCKRKI